MRFLFVMVVILMIFVSVYSAVCISKKKNKISGFVYVIGFLMLAAGIVDLADMINSTEYRGVFFFCGIVSAIEIYLAWLNTFISEKNSIRPILFSAVKIIAVASVLEISLFNINSYHLWFGNYEKTRLVLGEAQISGGNKELAAPEDALIIIGKDEVLVTYEGLDMPVGTLTADIDFLERTRTADIVIDITDDTHTSYRYNIAKSKAVVGNSRSMIIPCQFSGNVGTFRVKFTMKSESDKIALKSLVINSDIPFNISYMRWFIIVFVSIFAVIFTKSVRLEIPFYQNKSLCNALAAVFTAVCIITAVKFVAFKINVDRLADWKREFTLDYGNQISQEIVDAFEAGQVSLLDEVEPELLELENPYDWSQRSANKVECKWDHVMYNGKYYSYYGIAPVLLLFLPYHMFTGYYFSTSLAVLLFSIIGMIFLTMTYMSFIRKFFWKLPSGIVLCGLVIIQLSSGIWYSLGRTLFYEISISSGFAFVTMGAYCLINSNIINQGEISLPHLALSSLFLAFAVLCRPTLAVYCMAACVFYLFGFFKSGSELVETADGVKLCTNKKSKAAYLISALLPMFTLAGVQMYYNYIRFDSPLDFGIQYSITINDFTHAQYHTNFVLIGIYNYLFAAPNFKMEFPFITTPFTKLSVNGYYFSDSGNVSGILFMSLPVFAYLFSKKAYKLTDRRIRRRNALLIGITCVLMPFVIICSVWESGYAMRYIADFAWQITIGALAIIYLLYTKNNNRQVKDIYKKFMVGAVIWGFAVNIPQIFYVSFSASKYPELFYRLANIFEFWR